MAASLQKTMERLRHLAERGALTDLSDRQLLELFATASDELAFAALVRRHGSTVLAVCHRVLGNAHDAEDAFQATFLVLARKADNLRWQASVKNWLHGVAFRVALKARSQRLKRKAKENSAGAAMSGSGVADSSGELRAMLDEELTRLPSRYRAPLLLCYLEGKTRDEAAEELGWSVGSVKGRLERGREILRARLAQRGLPVSSVLCAAVLAESVVGAAVPPALGAATVRAGVTFSKCGSAAGATASAAHQLAHGVISAMLMTKIRFIVFGTVLAAAMLTGGTRLVSRAQQPAHAKTPVVALAEVQPTVDGSLVAQRDGDGPKDKKDRDQRKGEPRGERAEPEGIAVVVKSVDPVKGTITVLARRERAAEERTHSLASKDLKITVLPPGDTAKLSDLTPETVVFLKLNLLDEVVGITAQAPTVSGILAAVAAAKKEVTIGGERGAAMTFALAPNAKFMIGGKEAALDEFKVGTRVQVLLSLDKKSALALRSGLPERLAPGRGRDARADITGVIIGIHPEKDELEVLTGGEANPEIRTVALPKNMAIHFEVGGVARDVPLGKLAKPVNVAIFLNPENKKILKIDVVAPQIRTVVQSVDAAKRRLTFSDKTLPIAADARILIGRQEIQLSELTPGTAVQLILNPERTEVLGIQAVRGEGRR